MRAGLIGRFLIRWLVCSLGLWIAASFTSSINFEGTSILAVVVTSGLVLAIINSIIKPILVFMALPAVLLSLGLFMIVINGLTVAVASYLYEPLQIASFWAALFAGIVIGIVNLLVTTILEDK